LSIRFCYCSLLALAKTARNEFDDNIAYDIRRYTGLLAETCNSVTEPFDYILATKDITIPLLTINEAI